MFCPQCGKKFRFRNTFCPDCHVGLVAHAPRAAVGGDPAAPLTKVFATDNAALIALAQSLLDSERIEYMMRGDVLKGLGLGTGPVDFWVRHDDADRALELLRDLREQAERGLSAPDEER